MKIDARITCPLELVKVKLQSPNSTYKNVIHCATSLFKQNGIKALYRGFPITFLRDTPSFAAYFGVYEGSKRVLKSWNVHGDPALLLSGGLAGISAWIPCFPQDVIKSRIQTDPWMNSTRECAMQVWKERGLRGFFRGFGPTLVRAVPVASFLQNLKRIRTHPSFTFTNLYCAPWNSMDTLAKRKREEGKEKREKRVRFGQNSDVEPDKVLLNHQKVLGGQDSDEDLEPVKARKGAVKTQGYESDESDAQDSDDDEEDVPDQKQDNPAEDDMFGESFETRVKKPKVLKEIEGQEWNADAQDYTEDGVKVEPFNMDQEMEEGHFDEAGHYIRKKDENVVHDKWLHGVTKNDIEKAKEAHERQRIKDKERDLAEEKEVLDPNTIWCAVLNLLQPGETLVRALKRLGGNQKKEPKWKKKKTTKKEDPIPESENATQDRKSLEELTSLSDQLMSLGHFDIYDLTYEEIARKLQKANMIDPSWVPGTPLQLRSESDFASTKAVPFYEFKWSAESTEIHGPYSASDMNAWKTQGYFNQSQKAWIRRVSADENGNQYEFSEFTPSMNFV